MLSSRLALLAMLAAIVAAVGGCSALRRKLLFYPTHSDFSNGLEKWMVKGECIGYARLVPGPDMVWLMLHGNGGQAADRVYALPSFSPHDSVYIMEYPGYGKRPGTPSFASFNQAAADAYTVLRAAYPGSRIGVVGESIGSGPAALLATQRVPPDQIVLVVPFDNLKSVAHDHLPFFPVGLILGKSWDNVAALAAYRGPVDIYAAREDQVIPSRHARSLAESITGAHFNMIEGGHNNWAETGRVMIERR